MASTNEYTVSTLIQAVQDEGLLPAADPGSATNRLLGFLNREQRVYLAQLLLSAREDYQADHIDLVLQPGQTSFQIPSRAIASGIKMVEVISQGATSIPIHPIKKEMQYWYVVSGINGGYYLEGNNLILIQPGGGVSQTTSATLRITFFRRFNKMVLENAVGWLASVDGTFTIATLDNSTYQTPSNFSSTAKYDFVQGTPPFDALAWDLVPVSVVGNVFTFAAGAIPSAISTGDFLCLARQTPICQAPLEFHDVLVARALYCYLLAVGDPKATAAKANLDELRQAALSLVAPRVQAHSEILLNYNAPGWQRGSKRRRRRLF